MRPTLRYNIIANPISGSLPMDKRYVLLKRAAEILCAEIYGLDTSSAKELAQCTRERAERCDVLAVAGGDGTLSLVFNSVDLSAATLAFLPFGTGNALTHGLRYKGGPPEIAKRIRHGAIHEYDLIACGGKRKAFMVSLGIDAAAIRLYEFYRSQGYRGLKAYLKAGIKAYFKDYHPCGGDIGVDGEYRRVDRLLSLQIVKQPYFGMGLKVVPRARWNDARLHTQCITTGLPRLLAGLISGFTIGNRVGEYRCGKNIAVRLDVPQTLQIDGDLGWMSDRFSFRVLPGVLRLKH
jgi:undecaprenyl-diphosphatase